MDKRLGNALKYGISFAIAGVLLYFSFRGVDWKQFAAGLKQTSWIWVAGSMCLGLSAFFLRGLRWNMLLRPLDPGISRWRTIGGVCVGNLANCVIPTSGEFVRSALVSTKKAGFDKTLGTVALERAWDILIIGLVYVLILVCDWGGAGSFFGGNIWKPLLERFGGGAWLLVLAIALILALAIWAVVRFRDRSRFCGRIYGFGRGVLQGFVSFRDMKGKVWFLLYSVGIWVCYWFMCVCIIHAFPPVGHLGIMDALVLMAAGSLASLVPAPGGFGTYHYFVTLTLSGLFGIPWDTGLIYATISHESQAVTMLISGAISYFLLAASRKKD